MTTWALITLLFGYAITLILYARYTFIIHIPIISRIGWLIIALMIGYIPFIILEKGKEMPGKYTVYILYFIFITAFILLTLTLLTDIIWGVGLFIFKLKMSALPSFYLLLGFSILLSTWALYEGIKVPSQKEIVIRSDKITTPQTLVFLSDLHLHRLLLPQKLTGIVQTVNALKPDIVVLGGDTIDDKVSSMQPLVDQLSEIKAPKGRFFIVGNHEYYYGFQHSVNALKEVGYRFLYNSGESVDSVYIAGIPDRTADADALNLARTFETATPNQFRILVSHTPTDLKTPHLFDLALSGHTHGGQIFPFHIFAKLHNPYLNGLYTLPDGATLYVSRGAGQWGPQMRFLAPAEITVIKLQPAKK